MNESELNPTSPVLDDLTSDNDADEADYSSAFEVPSAVLEAFQKEFPLAVDPSFGETHKDGENFYEVEFTDQDVEFEATYSVDGTLLKIEEEIQLDELPQSVTESISQAYPDAILLEAEKITDRDGVVTGYEVEIEDDDVELEIHLDANGTILNTDVEDEADETE